MSYYTNDIDTLRQMISQSIPQLIISGVTVVTVLCIMLYFSVWLTLVVLFGVMIMTLVVKKIGGSSSRYFIRQQQAIGRTEGFVEEMMNGQKVVKVFCHEQEAKEGFDAINDALFSDSEKANRYANMLMPILNNIGNVLYVCVALVGGSAAAQPRSQSQPVRPCIRHQHCRPIPEYDQTVCRQHQPGVQPA